MSEKLSECSCGDISLHVEKIKSVEALMPQEEKLYDLAELFKVFGDSTRIRILSALHNDEMCVCDIAELLGMTHSAISHQLRVLKAARLVKSKRSGREVHYSLDDDHVKLIIEQGLSHIEHTRKYR